MCRSNFRIQFGEVPERWCENCSYGGLFALALFNLLPSEVDEGPDWVKRAINDGDIAIRSVYIRFVACKQSLTSLPFENVRLQKMKTQACLYFWASVGYRTPNGFVEQLKKPAMNG